MRPNKSPLHLFRVEVQLAHEAFVSAGPNPTYYVRDVQSPEIVRAEGLALKRLLSEVGPPQYHPIPAPVASNDLRDALEQRKRIMEGTSTNPQSRMFAAHDPGF